MNQLDDVWGPHSGLRNRRWGVWPGLPGDRCGDPEMVVEGGWRVGWLVGWLPGGWVDWFVAWLVNPGFYWSMMAESGGS